jgi:predicted acetyltransferase
MSQITRLASDDFEALFRITSNAYVRSDRSSATALEETLARFKKIQELPGSGGLYGAKHDGELMGGMLLLEFTMNLYGVTVKGAGVGMVAVGLVHKKQRVAKDLISFFLRWARREGMPVAMLYTFRPDFYRQMGFGWGTKTNHYHVQPASFPRGSREHVRILNASDAAAVHACYGQFYRRTHGMFERNVEHFEQMLGHAKQRVVGVERDGSIVAYLVWTFEPAHAENYMINNMDVAELVYEDGVALGELVAFLHTQSDQISRVVLHTQDAYLHHLLSDPRNASENFIATAHESNAQGVGILYRIVDLPAFFQALEGRTFGDQSCTVRFTITDDFLPENDGSTTVRFVHGRPEMSTDEAYDVEIRLECAHASSLLMGVLSVKHLHRYGLVDISNRDYLETLHQLLAVDEPPICMTYF